MNYLGNSEYTLKGPRDTLDVYKNNCIGSKEVGNKALRALNTYINQYLIGYPLNYPLKSIGYSNSSHMAYFPKPVKRNRTS